eukprot:350190-Chlamydomonas_euryale.AAC.3
MSPSTSEVMMSALISPSRRCGRTRPNMTFALEGAKKASTLHGTSKAFKRHSGTLQEKSGHVMAFDLRDSIHDTRPRLGVIRFKKRALRFTWKRA